MSLNRVIGKNNTLPWHIPEDLIRFKKKTMHYPVLMGRKTFESIGMLLPHRQNIILTNNPDYHAPGAEIIHSVSELYELVFNNKLFVIGGAKVYKQFMSKARYLHITEIQEEVEGDTFFPAIDTKKWCEISREKHDNGKHKFHYVMYVQRKFMEK